MNTLLLALIACPGPPPTPSAASFDDADGVAAADLDGDGVDTLIFITDTEARWGEHRVDLGGALQAVARGDVDGDGVEEAVIASGMSRDHRDAPARVWRVDEDGATALWEQQGERTQITDLRVVDGRVWVAAYVDAREVRAGFIVDGALDTGGLHSQARLAPAHLPLPPDAVAVGRIYGDAPKSPGDLKLIRGGQTTTLPSLRGVRSLAAADLDGDGDLELLVGDGWHYAYGQQADGRVALLDGPDWSEQRVIAHFGDDYTARSIEPIDGALLVTGTQHVHYLRRDALGWRDDVLGDITEADNAVVVHTPLGLAALISGEPARLVPLPR
ncbi:MAG: FG-GAP repeat protein [Alphaproteobacteria bacterium]|nr:FG-GAP repeat protein [Alphaproteobacteria bacterium]